MIRTSVASKFLQVWFLLCSIASLVESAADLVKDDIRAPKDNFVRSLIYGGDVVTHPHKDYPGFVWTGIGSGGWGCGGALIHDDIVVTAAHCQWVYRGNKAISVGPSRRDKTGLGEIFADDVLLVHPEYISGQKENDILLVKLNASSSGDTFDYNTDPSFPGVDDEVTVIGFGTTEEPGAPLSDELREVTVNVFSYQNCAKYFEDIDSTLNLCAGTSEGGKDACDSDSGSPLFIDNVVVGVTGDGIGCGLPGIPATYSRVAAYADWIKDSICDLSSNPPSDCDDDDDFLEFLNEAANLRLGDSIGKKSNRMDKVIANIGSVMNYAIAASVTLVLFFAAGRIAGVVPGSRRRREYEEIVL